MALRNQPYIPLYVQDFLTDEKLVECSAETTGVYIRLLCIMHKSEEYGTILLEQKYKQTNKQIENFACKLAKHMPYTIEIIHRSLHELINEGVLMLEDSKLLQKRMIRDNDISNKRAESGSKGGKKTQFAKAKSEANSENEYANEDEDEDITENIEDRRVQRGKKSFNKPTIEEITEYCRDRVNSIDPNKFFDYYESNGWKIGGKSKMKDWKAAVRNWERRGEDNGQRTNKFCDEESGKYDHITKVIE